VSERPAWVANTIADKVLSLVRAKKRIKALETALAEAAGDVEEYSQYLGEYLVKKWDVEADVARYRALAEGGEIPEEPAEIDAQ